MLRGEGVMFTKENTLRMTFYLDLCAPIRLYLTERISILLFHVRFQFSEGKYLQEKTAFYVWLRWKTDVENE